MWNYAIRWCIRAVLPGPGQWKCFISPRSPCINLIELRTVCEKVSIESDVRHPTMYWIDAPHREAGTRKHASCPSKHGISHQCRHPNDARQWRRFRGRAGELWCIYNCSVDFLIWHTCLIKFVMIVLNIKVDVHSLVLGTKRSSPNFTQSPPGPGHGTCSSLKPTQTPRGACSMTAISGTQKLFKHTSHHHPTRYPLTPGSRECTCGQSALPRSTTPQHNLSQLVTQTCNLSLASHAHYHWATMPHTIVLSAFYILRITNHPCIHLQMTG